MAVLTIDDAGRRARPASLRVSPRALAVSILVLLAVQHALLWAFLGFHPVAVATLLACGIAGGTLVWRSPWDAEAGIGVPTLGCCAAVALLLFVLGGEGRFVYANTDWQVRSAVLRDLTLQPWPFVYDRPGGAMILRAPLGMYLPPALAGKLLGWRAAELALLVQNAAWLTALLALGSTLFETRARRLAALGVVLGFSGMDIVGQYLAGRPLDRHLEWWGMTQFSSHVTQAFWVPQHALAGWTGAVLFLLWRSGRLPLAALLAAVPLLPLASPLAAVGVVPFAAWAGLETLVRRRLTWRDIAAPLAASALALPSLLYLSAGSDSVGAHGFGLSPSAYLVFEMLEVGPFLLVLWLERRRGRFGVATLALATATLLLVPFGQVGSYIDFCARASIPALAILAVLLADFLLDPKRSRAGTAVAGLAFLIGLATPLSELHRALAYPAAPDLRCSYFGVVPDGAATYVAPLGRLSPRIRPETPGRVRLHDERPCWDGPWPEP